jgi:mannosyltransferase OCH1-like enzyme
MSFKPFVDCMSVSKNFLNKELPDKWKIVQDLYESNIYQNTRANKIPKKIHQIWLGGSIPDNVKKLTQTIQDKNPDYEYKLWTDEDVIAYDFKNKELFYKAKNVGQRSDILRYAILEEYGGIYLDADFIGYKSFDSLLHLDFFVGVSYDKEPTVYNGLIGTTPGCKIITEANFIYELKDSDNMDVIKSTGPWFLTSKIYKNLKHVDNAAILPLTYFYPFPNDSGSRIYGDDYEKYVTDETICLHLWHTKWFV